MKHEKTIKKFIWHKIRHRYLKQDKPPYIIAEELNLDPVLVDKICDLIFFQEIA